MTHTPADPQPDLPRGNSPKGRISAATDRPGELPSRLDSPFSGVHKLNQTEMSRIQTSLETSYTRLAPGTPLPCTSDSVQLGPAREPS